MRLRSRRWLLTFLVAVPLGFGCGATTYPTAGVEPAKAKSKGVADQQSARLDEALSWLPPNTQTLAVCQGPFRIQRGDHDLGAPAPQPLHATYDREPPEVSQSPAPKLPVVPVRPLEAKLRALMLGNLASFGDGDLSWFFFDQTVLLAVEGSRSFRSPKQLGMMPYDGAHILIFTTEIGPAGRSWMNSLRKTATKVERIAGHEAVVFETMEQSDLWETWISNPQPNVLIWATDRGYLAEVLERMARRGRERALPENLPEWSQVDRTASFWAIRHYDRKDALNDPSSPLAGKKREANVPDEQATGVVISLAAKSQKLIITYLSTNEDAVNIAGEAWGPLKADGLQPSIRLEQPGNVRIIASLDDPNRTPSLALTLLLVLNALGHGVSL